MRRHLLPFILFLLGLFVLNTVDGVARHERNPFANPSWSISILDPAEHTAEIVFEADVLGEGTITLELFPSAEGTSILSVGQEFSVRIVRGERPRASWKIHYPADGYHRLADLRLTYSPAPAYEKEGFHTSDVIALYGEIRNGEIVNVGTHPDKGFTRPPTEIILDTKESAGRGSVLSSFPFTITITGRIVAASRFFQVQGVPGVRVFFDWDSDNNAGTYLHPTYLGGPDYAVTDEDGNYTFQRAVEHGDPNSFLYSTDHIRIFAESENDAAYDRDQGEGAIFVEQDAIPISVSLGTQSVSLSPAELDVDPFQGSALRYLHRARLFSVENLSYVPDRIGFESNTSANTRFNEGYWGGVQWLDQKIEFNGVPTADDGYHEYGHYVHFSYNPGAHIGSQVGNPFVDGCPSSGHSWDLETTERCAFSEGWAEFYSAACYTWWTALEDPDSREDADNNSLIGTVYQWPDHGQDWLPPNNGDVEGMVATFLYSLWDNVGLRTTKSFPDYKGDNEDLGLPYGYPKAWLLETTSKVLRYRTEKDLNGHEQRYRIRPYIRAYRDAYLERVNMWYTNRYPYHAASINALYDALTADNVEYQRPATPTELTITELSPGPGLQAWRKLNWNDNTEPSSIIYAPRSTGRDVIDLLEHNETGFYIFRKYIPTSLTFKHYPWGWEGPEDSRTDGNYAHIATVGADVLTYTDNQLLPKGQYVYVVVAYNTDPSNQQKLSIPKAAALVRVDDPIVIDDWRHPQWTVSALCGPPSYIQPGNQWKFFASRNVLHNPVYNWIAENVPGFIQLSGIDNDTLTVVNSYTPGMPIGTSGPFSLRCVIVDNGVADTSLPIYPVYTPLDSLNVLVRLKTAIGFVPETTNPRALDFVSRPGEKTISSRPLQGQLQFDSVSSLYHLRLHGLPNGSLSVDNVRLLRIRHPEGTILSGSAECGMAVYLQDSIAGLVEDERYPYGLEELPLVAAEHSQFGSVTDTVRVIDNRNTIIDQQDSLLFSFTEPMLFETDTIWVPDSLVYVDSSSLGWIDNYVLEVSGTYFPLGSPSEILTSDALSFSHESHSYSLEQNTPNPFAEETIISYTLGYPGLTRLEVFDVRGVRVAMPVNEYQGKGKQSVLVDLSQIAAGVYYYRLTSSHWSQSRIMTVIR